MVIMMIILKVDDGEMWAGGRDRQEKVVVYDKGNISKGIAYK